MKKRILIFALAIFTLLTLTSCGKKFTVTFNADGGTLAGEATVQVKKVKQFLNLLLQQEMVIHLLDGTMVKLNMISVVKLLLILH